MRSDRGFTLVELAIALMVIGLLIGGILKGQELVENARVTKTIRQVDAYKTGAAIFRNTYNALPGDLPSPSTRIPNCTTSPCNFAGNRDGQVHLYYAAYPHSPSLDDMSQQEARNFYLHMAKANMITGIDTNNSGTLFTDWGVQLPAAPYDGDGFGAGYYYAEYFSTGFRVGNYIVLVNGTIDSTDAQAVTARTAAQIDRKADDGKPYGGDIRAISDVGGSYPSNHHCVDTDSTAGIYLETGNEVTCGLIFAIE